MPHPLKQRMETGAKPRLSFPPDARMGIGLLPPMQPQAPQALTRTRAQGAYSYDRRLPVDGVQARLQG